MAYDLQEQEQIDALKGFWAQWGKLIGGAVLAVSLGFIGYKAWQTYQKSQAEQAAVVYGQLEQQLQAGQLDKAKATVATLQKDYAASAYAANGSLLAAKLAFDSKELGVARSQLKWVIEHADKDETLQAVARLRLAAVLLDEKQYDVALAELAMAHPVAFDAMFLDLKADVLVARGDLGGAREAYKAALAKSAPEAPVREFIQAKLDSLGS